MREHQRYPMIMHRRLLHPCPRLSNQIHRHRSLFPLLYPYSSTVQRLLWPVIRKFPAGGDMQPWCWHDPSDSRWHSLSPPPKCAGHWGRAFPKEYLLLADTVWRRMCADFADETVAAALVFLHELLMLTRTLWLPSELSVTSVISWSVLQMKAGRLIRCAGRSL